MRRWYVVYTRTGMERMALGHLEEQGICQTFLAHLDDGNKVVSQGPQVPALLAGEVRSGVARLRHGDLRAAPVIPVR